MKGPSQPNFLTSKLVNKKWQTAAAVEDTQQAEGCSVSQDDVFEG